MAYHQHGDARSFIQANPGCDRLQIVSPIGYISSRHHNSGFSAQVYGTVLGLAYLHSLKINHGDLKAVSA